jgi:hypothetical protein
MATKTKQLPAPTQAQLRDAETIFRGGLTMASIAQGKDDFPLEVVTRNWTDREGWLFREEGKRKKDTRPVLLAVFDDWMDGVRAILDILAGKVAGAAVKPDDEKPAPAPAAPQKADGNGRKPEPAPAAPRRTGKRK